MVHRISLDELASNLSEIVERVATGHEEYVVVRDGEPLVSLVVPSVGTKAATWKDFVAILAAHPMDDAWADDLEAVHKEMNQPIEPPR